jgi:hypothetical protein
MSKFYYWHTKFSPVIYARLFKDKIHIMDQTIASIIGIPDMCFIDLYTPLGKVDYNAQQHSKSLEYCMEYVDAILAKCGYTLLTDKLKILL